MASEAYVAGVENAKVREEARIQRTKERFDSLFEVSEKALASSLQAARERAKARIAKYGEKPSTVVRVLVVPKGSVPRKGSWSEYFRLDDERRAEQAKEATSDGGEV